MRYVPGAALLFRIAARSGPSEPSSTALSTTIGARGSLAAGVVAGGLLSSPPPQAPRVKADAKAARAARERRGGRGGKRWWGGPGGRRASPCRVELCPSRVSSTSTYISVPVEMDAG